jgi:hypothetical protein
MNQRQPGWQANKIKPLSEIFRMGSVICEWSIALLAWKALTISSCLMPAAIVEPWVFLPLGWWLQEPMMKVSRRSLSARNQVRSQRPTRPRLFVSFMG